MRIVDSTLILERVKGLLTGRRAYLCNDCRRTFLNNELRTLDLDIDIKYEAERYNNMDVNDIDRYKLWR